MLTLAVLFVVLLLSPTAPPRYLADAGPTDDINKALPFPTLDDAYRYAREHHQDGTTMGYLEVDDHVP